MSLFFGNNIALKGMMAQQTALNVAFNNVANASTDGYSRQRVDLQTSYSISGMVYGEQLGSGVDVGNIGRIRDEFLDYQLRTQASELTGQTTVHNILNNMEIVFNETAQDIGLSSDLNKFWNAWQDVSVNPSSPAVRTVLMESSVTLSDHIRGIYSQLSGIKDDIQLEIGQTVTTVESLANRINTRNSHYFHLPIVFVLGITIIQSKLASSTCPADRFSFLIDSRISSLTIGISFSATTPSFTLLPSMAITLTLMLSPITIPSSTFLVSTSIG
jgi:flagellar hook-associated protein 1 FlgK